MPYRLPKLETNEFYHIFNRSIAGEKIFGTVRLKSLFRNILFYYSYHPTMSYSLSRHVSIQTLEFDESLTENQRPGIEIAAYAIMPNHFHILLRQTREGEISRYLRRIELSYAHYYNRLKGRHGGVFCARFKSTWPKSQYGFQQVAKYIHLNPVRANLTSLEFLRTYPYTSYYNVFNPVKHVNTSLFMNMFENDQEYEEFLSRPPALPYEFYDDEF